MLFDTGSAGIYAMSDHCLMDDCPKAMLKYDTRSKTLKEDITKREELNYG